MKIPKKLPQFEKPALFVAAGEYEADFWLAFHGMLVRKEQVKMPPREEAKEKQGYITKSKGKELGAISHHGAYIENLKKKFQKKVHQLLHTLIAEYKSDEIYLFAPRYAAKRIMDGLDKSEQRKVRMIFYEEYTKISPLKLLGRFQKETEMAMSPTSFPKEEEKKILKIRA